MFSSRINCSRKVRQSTRGEFVMMSDVDDGEEGLTALERDFLEEGAYDVFSVVKGADHIRLKGSHGERN